jgi:hypothetical protein
MKTRTLFVAGAMALGLVAAAPGTASANILWCVGDPPVQVVTPGGNYVEINNYLYTAPAYAHLASQITADGSAASDGAGGSLVTIYVHVPSSLSRLYVVSADLHYQVTTTGSGTGGTEITLTLDVPEP